MKSLFDIVLLREQLKRFWAIGALAFLFYFLCVLLPLWGENYNVAAIRMITSILENKNPFVIILSVLAPFASVAVIFAYMYRKNSAGVMHAMPFTKMQLFATNFLAGYVLIIVPLVVFSVLLLMMPVTFGADHVAYTGSSYGYWVPPYWVAINVFPNGLMHDEVINTLPVVAGFLARAVLSVTFYYILFMTAAMVAGNPIIYMLVTGFLQVLVAGLYFLFAIASYYYVDGYVINDVLLEKIFVYTNPVLLSTQFTNAAYDAAGAAEVASLAPLYMSHIVIAVLLLALSVWMYHIRKLERAGDSVVFVPMKNFFIFLLSVGGMALLGAFLLALMKSIAAMYMGLVIGFTIAFFISQMIAEQSFHVFYKYKALAKHGCVALGIFAVVAVVSRTDITGYARYTPDPSEVQAVYFGYYRHGNDANEWRFIKDPDIINETLAVHQRIIDNRDEYRKGFLSMLGGNTSTRYLGDIGFSSQRLTYRLNNGKLIQREYVIREEFSKEVGLWQLLRTDAAILSEVNWINSPELIRNIYILPFLYTNETDTVRGWTNSQHFREIMIQSHEEKRSLCEAMKKDYIHYQANELWRYEHEREGEWYQANVRVDMAPGYNSQNQEWLWLGYAENTIAWLKEHGYDPVSDPID